ncbi:hypothetical protein [Peijinzhouia sedimentorum]
MKLLKTFFFTLITIASSCNPSGTDRNIYEQSRIPLGNEGLAEFFYWEFDENENLWKPESKELDGIKVFRDSLKAKLGKTRFEKVIKKESTQHLDKELLLAQDGNGDKKNAILVHTGTIGYIRPINSLESQILNYQLVKYPLLSHPTEFHGFIAFNEVLKKYRVYFGASDQPWPPHPDLLLEQLRKDIENGWQLKYHLHNHYEPKSNDYLGILAPSMSDAQYFKMLLEEFKLEKALITNGFHTVEIESADFSKLESH